MTTLREAVEKALDALTKIHPGNMSWETGDAWLNAVQILREALAQPEREPVAWTTMPDANDWTFVSGSANPNGKLNGKWYPLYATPPQRKPLTDEEIIMLTADTWGNASIAPQLAPAFARAIERAHGIGEKE